MIQSEHVSFAKQHVPHVDHELKRQARMHAEHSRVTTSESARAAALKLERRCLDCAAAIREGKYDEIRYSLNLAILFNCAVTRVARDMGTILHSH